MLVTDVPRRRGRARRRRGRRHDHRRGAADRAADVGRRPRPPRHQAGQPAGARRPPRRHRRRLRPGPAVAVAAGGRPRQHDARPRRAHRRRSGSTTGPCSCSRPTRSPRRSPPPAASPARPSCARRSSRTAATSSPSSGPWRRRGRTISLQRWSVRRVLLALGVVAVIVLFASASTRMFTPARLPVAGQPECDTSDVVVLMAQAVPTATEIPCLQAEPAGLSDAAVLVDRGDARFTMTDRVGRDAVTVHLRDPSRCDRGHHRAHRARRRRRCGWCATSAPPAAASAYELIAADRAARRPRAGPRHDQPPRAGGRGQRRHRRSRAVRCRRPPCVGDSTERRFRLVSSVRQSDGRETVQNVTGRGPARSCAGSVDGVLRDANRSMPHVRSPRSSAVVEPGHPGALDRQRGRSASTQSLPSFCVTATSSTTYAVTQRSGVSRRRRRGAGGASATWRWPARRS